jgi:hypothetical protein
VKGGGYTVPQLHALCLEAFELGAAILRDEIGMPETPPPPVLEGSAESRTILAALQLFLDQVLRSDPEEVAEGEWLSAQDCEQLIRTLKGEGS